MDYKEMYLELFRATEKAINILIEAQQKCEEQYISSPEIIELFPDNDDNNNNDNDNNDD